MDIGRVVSVVVSEPVVLGDETHVDIRYALETPLEYITIEISEVPVVEPVPA